ncbi:DUF1190 domain-containing protein [Ferrimonas lipolytica]|uniref:DUF1190 domain-containing protein n=1 Tax=Ferrimonas lipolytica TaxID=2724191 RepID=A0A6H1UAX5_9GAMM|nr:DUF1190 domain-containing protein [Ferrimonas lipolytica]QIZ76194.1 DUF1190 domain-containing protein [Ferrimonas lipolytica]
MKRSSNVRLARFRKSIPTATGVALSVSLVLSGCSPAEMQETAQIYSNAEECKAVYPDQPQLCDQVFSSAQMDHLTTAPRFTSQAECENEFGAEACQPAPEGSEGNPEAGQASAESGGGSWFMPMMMGYMMGNMMSGGRSTRYTPVYGSRSKTSPLNGKIFTGNGTVVGKAGDRTVRTTPSAFQKPSAPTRVTRSGGFGKMAAAKSSSSSMKSKSGSRSFGG